MIPHSQGGQMVNRAGLPMAHFHLTFENYKKGAPWGVLLNEAQNISVVALYPWLLYPVVPVILVILTFNFFGDGLRDAADPYK